MAMNINDLPNEMILEILEKLPPREVVVNTSKTCLLWRNLYAQYTVRPKILALAAQSRKFKRTIQDMGWTGTDDEPQLILSLYHTYEDFTSKSHPLKCPFLLIIKTNSYFLQIPRFSLLMKLKEPQRSWRLKQERPSNCLICPWKTM